MDFRPWLGRRVYRGQHNFSTDKLVVVNQDGASKASHGDPIQGQIPNYHHRLHHLHFNLEQFLPSLLLFTSSPILPPRPPPPQIYKSQIESLTKFTSSFQSQHDYNPFEEPPKEKSLSSGTKIPLELRVENILPFVDFDAFENALVPLLNDSGGLIATDPTVPVQLVNIATMAATTPNRRAMILEILSNTKSTPTLTFLQNGGLEVLTSWLKISPAALRDGLSLSTLHHTLYFLLHLSIQHSQLFHHTPPASSTPSSSSSTTPTPSSTATALLIHDIKDTQQQTTRLFQNNKLPPPLIGFDHLAQAGNPFSHSTHRQITVSLKQTILNLYEEFVIRIQGGRVISTAGGGGGGGTGPSSSSYSTSGSGGGGGGERKRSAGDSSSAHSSGFGGGSVGGGVNGSQKKKPKRESAISTLLQEEKSQLSRRELSKNILAAKEKKVMYSAEATSSNRALGRAMPYTGPGIPLSSTSTGETLSLPSPLSLSALTSSLSLSPQLTLLFSLFKQLRNHLHPPQ
jgi:hypothetical protein